MKRNLARILALISVIAAIGLAIFWSMYLDEKVNTLKVYRTNIDLPKAAAINPAGLSLINLKVENIPDGAISDLAELQGKETVIALPRGSVLTKTLFDDANVVLDKDQIFSPIPNQWIFSVPGSLRRKDLVDIYAYPLNNTNPVVSKSRNDQESNPVNSASTVSNIVYNTGPVLSNITVAFVKDSSNQEVKPSDNKQQRFDATGSISLLELVLTGEQFSLLEQKALDGNKFIFVYR